MITHNHRYFFMYTAPIISNKSNYYSGLSIISNRHSEKIKTSNFKNDYKPLNTKTYKAYGYNLISFKSNNIDLLSDFAKSGSSKLYQYLDSSKKTSPLQVRKFLNNVLADDNLTKNFINEIISEPRKSAEILINLSEKLGGEDNFRDWYFAKGGYREKFGKYIGDYYEKAKNVDELLALMPNWKLSDIVAKYHNSISGNVFEGGDPVIGNLPQEFGNIRNFSFLIQALNRNPSGSGEFYAGTRRLWYNNLKNSDDKLVFRITSCTDNKSYIVKIDKKYSDYIHSRLRANSIFLETMIGKYLSAHDCKDTPKFHFYDFFHNASIFEDIKGHNLVEELNPLEMNKLTPDLLALGIRTNDTHLSNYLKTDNGFMNIDLGNADWFDGLKPGDIAHSINFPNQTGLDFSNTYNLLDFAKFIKKTQKN